MRQRERDPKVFYDLIEDVLHHFYNIYLLETDFQLQPKLMGRKNSLHLLKGERQRICRLILKLPYHEIRLTSLCSQPLHILPLLYYSSYQFLCVKYFMISQKLNVQIKTIKDSREVFLNVKMSKCFLNMTPKVGATPPKTKD